MNDWLGLGENPEPGSGPGRAYPAAGTGLGHGQNERLG
jgi:hypothetical protein